MLWHWSFGHTKISAMICFSVHQTIGGVSNNDGDVNENDKKAIGLDWQNNNSTRALRFLDISLPSLHNLDVNMPNFTFCGGRERKRTTFFFFSSTSIHSSRIHSKKLLTFDELNEKE